MTAVVSHPHGNANVRGVVRGLHRAGLLARFVTTLGVSDQRPLSALLPSFLRRELGRRAYPVPPGFLATAPLREAARLACLRLGWRGPVRHERGWASVDAVWRETDCRTAALIASGNLPADTAAAYAYEDGARDTFREAKRQGWRCIYDLPIGFYQSAQRLYAEERDRMPAFASTLTGLDDSPEKLARKQEEIELADIVVACSPFVSATLAAAGIDARKIREVQFGVPEIAPPPLRAPLAKGDPVRVLFAGRIGQRKGIGDLLQAVAQLGDPNLRLTLLGAVEGPPDFLKPYAHLFEYLPPRPQAGVFEAMARSDLFVLPSLFEGQALVVLEAMQCGLPVIVTPATGAAHLVEDGVNGFVVPIRSAAALAEKLAWCLDHRDRLRAMGLAARAAVAPLTWRAYENKIAAIVGGDSVP
jgi:hypothetical protein